jgi:hypothetical protein
MTEPYFASLDAFRAHCGEPTMPLEQCPICSKLPPRVDKDADEHPRELGKLQLFIEPDIQRCPSCHRLYLYSESTGGGNDIYRGNELWWCIDRHTVESLFNSPACIGRRVRVDAQETESFFPLHPLLRIGARWHVLDSDNAMTVLEDLAMLIEKDPPRMTEWWRASLYAKFVDAFENPDDRVVSSFYAIRWKAKLTPDEQRRIEDTKAASQVAESHTDTEGDNFVVRFWVTSKRRLICRVMTIRPNGRYVREDAVIADDLPFATPTRPMFASLDAFRAHCGKPAMPREQCPICSKLPAVCTREVEGSSASDDRPPEALELQDFMELGSTDDGYAVVVRCPTCHRLYVKDTDSLGATLDYSCTWTRYDNVDAIFDLSQTVMMRLPDCEIDRVHPVRFFPRHVLVRIDDTWCALDANNRLLELSSKAALAKLIERDPPRTELPKYADFVAEIERLG